MVVVAIPETNRVAGAIGGRDKAEKSTGVGEGRQIGVWLIPAKGSLESGEREIGLGRLLDKGKYRGCAAQWQAVVGGRRRVVDNGGKGRGEEEEGEEGV